DKGRLLIACGQAGECVGQGVHAHAVVVHRDWHELESELLEYADRAAIFELLQDDRVTWFGKALRAELQTLHGAVTDDEVVQRRSNVVVVLEALLRDFAER